MIENVINLKISVGNCKINYLAPVAYILYLAGLKSYNIKDRIIILCDTVVRLPASGAATAHPANASSIPPYCRELVVSSELIREKFLEFSLLNSQVFFCESRFKPNRPEIVLKAIPNLPRYGNIHGLVIILLQILYNRTCIDIWGIIYEHEVVPAHKKAVHTFSAKRSLTPELNPIGVSGHNFRDEYFLL